tara:strand:- start:1214 stop:2878 length:1665 start_codon:yes stop_codon:yes gene_type:complete
MDKNKKKNVLFLLIDGLRYDTLSKNKFCEYLFPNFSKLKKKSIFKSAFSNGVCTQMALPSIFSSTYPLDYDGYENGIRGRPKSISEVYKEYGYKTYLITNCSEIATSYDGYHRGFDEIQAAPDYANLIEKKISLTIRPKFLKLSKSELNKDESLNYLKKEIRLLCESVIKSLNTNNYIWSKKLYKHNKKIVKSCIAELDLMEKNPLEIKNKIIEDVPRNYWNSFGYWKYLGKNKPNKYIFFFNKLFHISSFRLRQFIRKLNILPFKRNLNSITIRSTNIIKEIHKILKSTSQPVFIYSHLMDVHDNSEIGDLFYFFKKVFYFPKWLIAKIKGYTPRSFSYDSSLMILDEMLSDLFSDITKLNEKSDTLVFLSSDHGSAKAFTPKRKDGEKDYFLGMYEESLKIPMLIFNSNLENNKECKLIDSMGLATTLLESTNITPHSSFKGKSLYLGGKPTVISEHTGRGLPDVVMGALYFVLTSKNEKLFVCIKEKELILKYYDLIYDPFEEENLIEKNEYRDKILHMLKYLVKERKEVIFQRLTKTKCEKFDFKISDIA